MKALLAKQKMINKVVLIPEHRIKPNPYQPRRVFDQEKIEQLAASIAQYGLLQPITVLPLEDGSYQLVAGERRLLACRRLRMQEVPAILTTMDEERSSALALVENIQRCDLNFFEEAAAIQKLMKMGGYTQQAVAKKLGKNQSTIANKLRLLRLSPDCCRLLTEHDLTERHARALLRLEDEEERLNALHHIIRQHLNVAQTEQYIDKRLSQLQATPPSGRRVFLLKDVRLFLNSLDRGLRLVREAGIGAESRREDTEDAILLTIRIPKNRQVS